jgi:DNA-binding response OmpR family regulator
VLEVMNGHDELSTVPVLLISAAPPRVVASAAAGAAWLTKPLSVGALLDAIEGAQRDRPPRVGPERAATDDIRSPRGTRAMADLSPSRRAVPPGRGDHRRRPQLGLGRRSSSTQRRGVARRRRGDARPGRAR